MSADNHIDDAPDAAALVKAVTGGEDETVENPPFANYIELPPENGEKKPKRIPISIDKLTRCIWDRLDNFPRRLGSSLFYYDPKSKKPIRTLDNKQALFGWLQGDGNCLVCWAHGSGFVTQDQLFERIFDKARFYEGTSAAPYHPPRDEVFPTYGELPEADPEHRAFWKLVGRFNPADDANRTVLAAFLLTPLWYDGVNDRPMCLVDTDDAQGSGKTTVVKMIARLYDRNAEAEYLDIDIKTLLTDDTKIKKELLSAEGRSKRIVLFDNLSKTLKGDALAKLVTGGKVSGMAPYGHGTETRPADFTFYGTMNGASTDEDMTTRSYTMRVKKIEDPDPEWESKTVAFIRDNRLQILADGIDMIKNAPRRHRRHKSRFGAYDETVLSAVCKTDEEFDAADDALADASGRANEDVEIADEFLKRFKTALGNIKDYKDTSSVVIAQTAVEWLLSKASGNLERLKGRNIRNLIKAGHLDDFSKDFERLTDSPKYQGHRERAFFYGMKIGDPDSFLPIDFQFIEKSSEGLKIAFSSNMTRPQK